MTSNYTKAAAWVGCIVALLVGAVMFVNLSAGSSPTLGAVSSNTGHTEIFPWDFAAGIQVGPPSNAPVLKMVAAGTCNLSTSVTSLVASSTGKYTCNAGTNYNFVATDMVIMDLATTSPGVGGYGTIFDSGPSYVSVTGQNAQLTTTLYNASGAATSSYAVATTSVEFFVYRVQ